jgi:hypothetical protein
MSKSALNDGRASVPAVYRRCSICKGPLPCIKCAQELSKKNRKPDKDKVLHAVVDGDVVRVHKFTTRGALIQQREIIGPLQTEDAHYLASDIEDDYAETDPESIAEAARVQAECARIRNGEIEPYVVTTKTGKQRLAEFPKWTKREHLLRRGVTAATAADREAAITYHTVAVDLLAGGARLS